MCASCLCTIVLSASKNESKWFLKISQDQMLLQTKPIKFRTCFRDNKFGREVQSRHANKILEKMYIVTCLVHGF